MNDIRHPLKPIISIATQANENTIIARVETSNK